MYDHYIHDSIYEIPWEFPFLIEYYLPKGIVGLELRWKYMILNYFPPKTGASKTYYMSFIYKDKDKIAIFEHCDGCLPLKVVEAIG